MTSQDLLGVGRQHAPAEIGKGGAVFQGHELPEPLLDHGLSVQAQQGGPGQVDFQDPRLVVPEEIAHRGEVEEVVILLRGLLGLRLGPLQFLVLHLQFDLVDLQFVDQGPRVDLGRGRIALGRPGVQTLLRLAAQLGRFFLFLHGCTFGAREKLSRPHPARPGGEQD